jgi:hypothetical protein
MLKVLFQNVNKYFFNLKINLFTLCTIFKTWDHNQKGRSIKKTWLCCGLGRYFHVYKWHFINLWFVIYLSLCLLTDMGHILFYMLVYLEKELISRRFATSLTVLLRSFVFVPSILWEVFLKDNHGQLMLWSVASGIVTHLWPIPKCCLATCFSRSKWRRR